MKISPLVFAAASVLFVGSTFADEGMWTFDNFPVATVNGKNTVSHRQGMARPRAARRGPAFSGCSASMVTAEGWC